MRAGRYTVCLHVCVYVCIYCDGEVEHETFSSSYASMEMLLELTLLLAMAVLEPGMPSRRRNLTKLCPGIHAMDNLSQSLTYFISIFTLLPECVCMATK